jgi:hypothetical protein
MQQQVLQIREPNHRLAVPGGSRIAPRRRRGRPTGLKVGGDPAEMRRVKWITPNRSLCALALLALLAAACGSTGTSTSSVAEPHLSPGAIGRDRVTQMVLTDADLPGFRLQSTGAETLKEQLPPPGLPQVGLARRLVRANWIASEHSILIAGDGHTIVYSDANLFRQPAAAQRIWALELHKAPGVVTRYLKIPPGAPAGARFAYQRQGAHAGFQIAWRQGPVIGIEVMFVPPSAHISGIAQSRIAGLLATAARAQALRIADVESGANAA